MLENLVRFADLLDRKQMFKEANYIDSLIKKFATATKSFQAAKKEMPEGWVLKNNKEWDEYIVYHESDKNNKDAWYHTDDLDDAVGTAQSEAKRSAEA